MVRFTNKFGLPEEFYNYRRFKPYSKGDADISVTSLIKPPLMRVLEEHYDDQIEIDVVDQMWALYGTAIHEVLATGSGMQDIAEEDLYIEREGWKIKAGVDVQKASKGGYIIHDYKSTTVFAYKKAITELESHYWTFQGNMYAHMVRELKGPVLGMRVYAILRDWSRKRAEEDEGNVYPRAPIMPVDVPLWSNDETEIFMTNRIKMHQQAEVDFASGIYPDTCPPGDRWRDPPKYEVYSKPGNKAPQRVVEDEETAEQILRDKGWNEGVVRVRESQDVRCLSFCNVRPWCPYGSMLEEG